MQLCVHTSVEIFLRRSKADVPFQLPQWHMRQHIQAGKESQSSLINYTKAGRPFINLVTM